jgi:hypothetical protein
MLVVVVLVIAKLRDPGASYISSQLSHYHSHSAARAVRILHLKDASDSEMLLKTKINA